MTLIITVVLIIIIAAILIFLYAWTLIIKSENIMCGIVGIYLKTKKYQKSLGKMLSGMLNNMESRGPDSAGFAI